MNPSLQVSSTPMCRLAACKTPDPRRLLVALSVYLDGSHKPLPDLLTLGAVIARAEVWPDFEGSWRDVLAAHHLLYWHTSSALSGRADRDFVEEAYRDSWTSEKGVKAKADLEGVVNYFLASHRESRAVQLASCTVDLDAYRRAQSSNPCLRKAEAICVNACVDAVFRTPGGDITLIFDGGEAFRHEIDAVYARDKYKPHVKWVDEIDSIGHGSARKIIGLQAADLIAWQDAEHWIKRPTLTPIYAALRGTYCDFYDLARIQREFTIESETERARRIRRAGRKSRETRLLDERGCLP